MPTALTHKITIPGIVLPWFVPPREVQQMTTKFWGVRGESRIDGFSAGRSLEIPVLVYDAAKFNTRAKLSTFLDEYDYAQKGQESTLVVNSVAGRPPYKNTTFEGVIVIDGPKIDEAGLLGGGAFALCRFLFRQHL